METGLKTKDSEAALSVIAQPKKIQVGWLKNKTEKPFRPKLSTVLTIGETIFTKREHLSLAGKTKSLAGQVS